MYTIPFYSRRQSPAGLDWQRVPPAPISHYRWAQNSYRPRAFGKLAALANGLAVLLWAGEDDPRRVETEPGSPVFRDSCLEFFANFNPLYDSRYFNFELNANGTLLVGFGLADSSRVFLETGRRLAAFGVAPRLEAGGWQVVFTVPYTFIREHQPGFAPREQGVITGNFFKCGDGTPAPHYGCWSPVELEEANFHRPEFFAPMVFARAEEEGEQNG